MWKYVKKIGAENKPSMKDCLPQENGLLSKIIPSSTIASANKAVLKLMEDTTRQERRGKYGKYSLKERAEVGKRAAEFGITSTIKYYETVNPSRQLLSSSVYTWKVQ